MHKCVLIYGKQEEARDALSRRIRRERERERERERRERMKKEESRKASKRKSTTVIIK